VLQIYDIMNVLLRSDCCR